MTFVARQRKHFRGFLAIFLSVLLPPKRGVVVHKNSLASCQRCLMIAFITCNSNLVPLLEGLCSSNLYRFEFSIFGVFASVVTASSHALGSVLSNKVI